jgi:hypothetical protein
MKIFGVQIGKEQNTKFPIISDSNIRLKLEDQSPAIRPELKGIVIPENKKPTNIEHVGSTVLTYHTGNMGRGQFVPPEYDLAQIGRVEDTDSYVHQAFLKKIGLLFKEGYDFVGGNPKTIQYVKLRFEQMARATGVPTDELIRGIGAGLVKKSNAFLVKVRKESASGGKVRTAPGGKKEIQPVAGYFVAPPETMEVDADEFGKIRKWKQTVPGGQYKLFSPDDVVHFYFNKKEGLFFGTPTLVPVIDDIRALRKIEENIEMLIYQHLFPLFHYKIGSDEMPATMNEYGENEIDVAKREIRYMPSEGGLVTSHRHEIKLIGSENRSLRAESYLEHFKKRVFSGLGISAVDMGEGECYDEHTQTLTENGFKFHWAIDHKTEKIATFNFDTRKIEFHIPNSKYEGFYSGPMVKIKNDYVDLLVTPEHDMWVWNGKECVWTKMKAIDIAKGKAYQKFMFMSACPFQDLNGYQLNPVEQVAFAKLAGYLVANGELEKDKIKISTTGIHKGLSKFADLLTQLDIQWTIEKDITPHSQVNYIYFDANSKGGLLKDFIGPDKFINVEKLNLDLRREAVSTFTRSVFESKGLSRFRHKTDSHVEKDILQRLFLSTGMKLKVVQKTNGNDSYYHMSTNLNFRNRINSLVFLKRDVSIVQYSGITYCYNVPNHLFVTRRNNKITIQGNTANRATSDNMSRNLVDSVKDIQRTLESQFTEFVINELLLESTFGVDVLDDTNDVRLRFKEIDLDHQIKKENHYADLFQKNSITIHEARVGMGRQPFRIPTSQEIESTENIEEAYPEWYSTFWKLIDEPKMLITAGDEPYSPAAKAAAESRSTALTEAGRQETGAEKAEHEIDLEKEKAKAKAKAKPKVKKDNFLSTKFNDLESDLVLISGREKFEHDMFKQLAFATRDLMTKELKSKCMAAFSKGYSSLNKNTLQQANATILSRGKVNSRADFYLNKLMQDTIKAVERQNIADLPKSDRIQRVKAIFDSLRYRNDFIEDVEVRKIENFGLLQAAKDLGFSHWKLNLSPDACKMCKSYSIKEHSLSDLIEIEDLPPYHANARATVEIFNKEPEET